MARGEVCGLPMEGDICTNLDQFLQDVLYVLILNYESSIDNQLFQRVCVNLISQAIEVSTRLPGWSWLRIIVLSWSPFDTTSVNNESGLFVII